MAVLAYLPRFMSRPIVAEFQRLAPEIKVWTSIDDAPPEEVEVVIAWSIKPGILSSFPNLKMVSAATAGVDKIMPSDLPANVSVTRIVDPDQPLGISHYVVAAALRHIRGLALYAEQQRRGEWIRHPNRDISQCRIGVLGLGSIGSAVAKTFAGLGFPVLGWSRSEKQLEGITSHVGDTGLSEVLAGSSVLVCTLPLTEETRGLLNRETLSQLPEGAFIINVGRGEHIVEPEFLELLDSGHLAGAALDVFTQEPPQPDDPIWTHPRIEATPHIATEPSYELAGRQCVENVRRLREGKPLLNEVDRQKGY